MHTKSILKNITDTDIYVWGECGDHTFAKPFRLPIGSFQNIDDVLSYYSKNKESLKPIFFGDNNFKTQSLLIAHLISNNFN